MHACMDARKATMNLAHCVSLVDIARCLEPDTTTTNCLSIAMVFPVHFSESTSRVVLSGLVRQFTVISSTSYSYVL